MACPNGIKIAAGLGFGGNSVRATEWTLPDHLKGTPSEAGILKANPAPDLSPHKMAFPMIEGSCQGIANFNIFSIDIGANVGMQWNEVKDRGSLTALPIRVYAQTHSYMRNIPVGVLTQISLGGDFLWGKAFRLKDGSLSSVFGFIPSAKVQVGASFDMGSWTIQGMLGAEDSIGNSDINQGYSVPMDWWISGSTLLGYNF